MNTSGHSLQGFANARGSAQRIPADASGSQHGPPYSFPGGVALSGSSPATDDSDKQGPKSTRKGPWTRKPVACSNCRKRKIRCLGNPPCSFCRKYGMECISQSLRANSNAVAISDQTNSNAEIEVEPLVKGSGFTQLKGGSSANDEDTASVFESSGQESWRHSPCRQPTHVDTYNVLLPESILVNAMGQPFRVVADPSQTSQAVHHGSSSVLSFVQLIIGAGLPNFSIPSALPPASINTGTDPARSFFSEDNTVLPIRSVSDDLLQTYFTKSYGEPSTISIK